MIVTLQISQLLLNNSINYEMFHFFKKFFIMFNCLWASSKMVKFIIKSWHVCLWHLTSFLNESYNDSVLYFWLEAYDQNIHFLLKEQLFKSNFYMYLHVHFSHFLQRTPLTVQLTLPCWKLTLFTVCDISSPKYIYMCNWTKKWVSYIRTSKTTSVIHLH